MSSNNGWYMWLQRDDYQQQQPAMILMLKCFNLTSTMVMVVFTFFLLVLPLVLPPLPPPPLFLLLVPVLIMTVLIFLAFSPSKFPKAESISVWYTWSIELLQKYNSSKWWAFLDKDVRVRIKIHFFFFSFFCEHNILHRFASYEVKTLVSKMQRKPSR